MQSNLYDVVITRAAHQLRPGYLNEQEWQRHSHADLASLEDWSSGWPRSHPTGSWLFRHVNALCERSKTWPS
jgi:hypothetical protein